MELSFKSHFDLHEACLGYVIGEAFFVESRSEPEKLRKQDFTHDPSKFLIDPGDPKLKVDKWVNANKDKGESCPLTPLSGYERHIKAIQNFAHQSPENFAQVLMFSPLSANVPFSKHWDNFYTLMLILKHKFPNKVTKEELQKAVDSFGDKYHAMAHSISSFKFDTIADIWSNRKALFSELNGLAKASDDVQMIERLSKIKGVQPVKAGFIMQLLWGRAGCIDTHNLDIYKNVFPDLAGHLDEPSWQKKGGAKKYVTALEKLKERGIGTKQLWDVWVDFVESFYIMISHHGRGTYDMQGPALDPNDPEYDELRGKQIPKSGTVGKDRVNLMVPVVGGKVGGGASATHLPMEPDEALEKFYKVYRKGEKHPDASAVAFHKDKSGLPLDQSLGKEPSALHYFGPAVSDLGVNPDHVKWLINKRLEQGGKLKRKADYEQSQSKLFK